MVKVEYEFQGQSGSLELKSVTGYINEKELIDSLETSDIQEAILEEVLSLIAPGVDPLPEMDACERGGERNVVSSSSEAKRLGFNKLKATIDGNEITILART
ncbi:hypothetical protein ACWOVX_004452 [Vibrio vulnificus]|nr:hypothetical protein [Vibrio vulnificus]